MVLQHNCTVDFKHIFSNNFTWVRPDFKWIKNKQLSPYIGCVSSTRTQPTATHYRWIIPHPELFLTRCILLSRGVSSFKKSYRVVTGYLVSSLEEWAGVSHHMCHICTRQCHSLVNLALALYRVPWWEFFYSARTVGTRSYLGRLFPVP